MDEGEGVLSFRVVSFKWRESRWRVLKKSTRGALVSAPADELGCDGRGLALQAGV